MKVRSIKPVKHCNMSEKCAVCGMPVSLDNKGHKDYCPFYQGWHYPIERRTHIYGFFFYAYYLD